MKLTAMGDLHTHKKKKPPTKKKSTKNKTQKPTARGQMKEINYTETTSCETRVGCISNKETSTEQGRKGSKGKG